MWIILTGQALSVVWLLASPLRSARDLPLAGEELGSGTGPGRPGPATTRGAAGREPGSGTGPHRPGSATAPETAGERHRV